jgi:endogenous inhibitor of DNA gyrase (YacG/DUF329 family)
MDKVVSCPRCSKPVAWGPASPWRPFCSERCRMIDLGDWLDENHRISDPLGEPQDDETDVEPSSGAH